MESTVMSSSATAIIALYQNKLGTDKQNSDVTVD